MRKAFLLKRKHPREGSDFERGWSSHSAAGRPVGGSSCGQTSQRGQVKGTEKGNYSGPAKMEQKLISSRNASWSSKVKCVRKEAVPSTSQRLRKR